MYTYFNRRYHASVFPFNLTKITTVCLRRQRTQRCKNNYEILSLIFLVFNQPWSGFRNTKIYKNDLQNICINFKLSNEIRQVVEHSQFIKFFLLTKTPLSIDMAFKWGKKKREQKPEDDKEKKDGTSSEMTCNFSCSDTTADDGKKINKYRNW